MRSQPNRNYVSSDVVMTPDWLACDLALALAPSGVILEPCAGDLSFVMALEEYATEIASCEAGDAGFEWWTRHVDWVITNPPWSQFRVFLKHSMEVADNVALLATVNHWWTKRRVADVAAAGFGYRHLFLCEWPAEWPSSGFQLGMMHIQRGYRGPLPITRLEASAPSVVQSFAAVNG